MSTAAPSSSATPLLHGAADGAEVWPASPPSEFSPRFLRFYGALARHRRVILVGWLAVLVWGAFTGLDFVRNSEDTPSAPGSSRAGRDKAAFADAFPERATEQLLIVYAGCASRARGCQVACPATACKRACAGERDDLRAFFAEFSHTLLTWADAHRAPGGEPLIRSYTGYYNLSGTHLDQAKCTYTSEDGRATMAFFTYSDALSKSQRHMIINKMDELFDRVRLPADVEVGLTGIDSIAKEGTEASEAQLFNVDVFTLPVAFCLFASMVRSWRLLALCVANAVITAVGSFAVLGLVMRAIGHKPLSVLATMSEALSLSMSIDYSLFLHRRFRDEVKNGRSPEDATKVMLQQAGQVVGLSCATFASVFAGFLFLPSADLSALGLVCVVTLLVALAVNVTNTTAALVAFPRFFAYFQGPPACLAGRLPGCAAHDAPDPDEAAGEPPRDGEAERGNASSAPTTTTTTTMQFTVTGKARHRRGAPYGGRYFRFLVTITSWPYNLLLVGFAYSLVVPLALQVLRLEHNQDALQIAPRHSRAAHTFEALREAFPGGLLGPFSLVVVADDLNVRDPAQGPAFFARLSAITDDIARKTGVDASYMLGPNVLQGRPVSYARSRELRNPRSALCRVAPDLCALYQYVFERAVSPAGNAVVVEVFAPFNPFGPDGMRFVDTAHDAIDALEREVPATRVLLCGMEVEMYANMKVAFDSFPWLVLGTLVIVFALLGVGFRSAFVPVRLSLTVFLPLAAVFGFAVLVYQDGALEWTGLEAVRRTEGGFFWFVPITTLMQSVGLVLDYDVFIVHRVLEHRQDGYTVQAAIIKAVWEVNSTIVVAGLIMASVFGGMMLSAEVAVDQFGWLLCTSVLVDTFIVQSLLVPAIMSFGDRFSWWPRVMPSEGLIGLDDAEFAE